MTRQRLPNRRPAETVELEHNGSRFTVNLQPAQLGTPSGSPVTYRAGNFTSILLPTGVTGPDVTSLFTFAGAFAGTPTASASSGALAFTFTPVPVPEPAAILLICGAAAGLARWRSRRPGR